MKFAKCGNCGAGLIEKGEEYVCEYCKRTYKDDSIKAAYEKVRAAMQETLQGVITEENLRKKNEQIANRRQSLYKARKSEFIDNDEVKFWSDEILKFLPNDTQATFYSLAASEKWTEVNRFLSKLDGKTVPYLLEDFVDFLTNGRFVGKCMLQMQDLLARTFASGSDEYKNCQKLISEAVEREKSGIFDTCLPRDVFVAYSSKDKERVYELVEYLEDNGLNCFVAMRNLAKGVDAQRYYNERLKEAIDNCQVFVFVSSKNSRTRNCDAYDIEMMYVKERDLLGSDNPNYYNNNYSAYLESYREKCKPRVEWLVDEYGSSIYERQVKQFFCGLTWCTDKESVLDAVADHINNRPIIVTEKDKLSKENEALKAELERKRAELEKEQQEELARQKAELERTKAELEKKQQEELAKKIAEFEKQKAEFEKQKAELARRKAEMESEKAAMQSAGAEIATVKAEQGEPVVSVINTSSKINEEERDRSQKELVDVLKKQATAKASAEVKTTEQDKAAKFTSKGCDYSIKSAKQAKENFVKELQEMRERQAAAKAQEQAEAKPAPVTTSEVQQSPNESVHASPLSDFEIVNGVLQKYKGKGGDVVIPDEVEQIGYAAFKNCLTVTSVNFTKNSRLLKIDGFDSTFNGAFSGCKNLKSIQIPAKLTTISGGVFYGCDKLEKVEIFDLAAWFNISFSNVFSNPLHYAKNLYLNGKLLTDIVIPASVMSLKNYIFYNCLSLTSIKFEKGSCAKNIGAAPDGYCHTFSGCKNLKTIEIPATMDSINIQAFDDCESLEAFLVDCENKTYKSQSGDLYTKDGKKLLRYAIGKKTAEENIYASYIGAYAFSGCQNLKHVTISSCLGIDEYAFSVRNWTGHEKLSLEKVTFASSCMLNYIGRSAFAGCSCLTEVNIPASVRSIGREAFYGCSGIKNVTFGKGSFLNSIGMYAFEGLKSLNKIVIPANVMTIEKDAFKNCSALTIFAEAKSKPKGWLQPLFGKESWNPDKRPVKWGYKQK